jgi:hypothetical protein
MMRAARLEIRSSSLVSPASLAAKLLATTTPSSAQPLLLGPSNACMHLLKSFLESAVSAGSLNKSTAAAASIIISSLTYICDNTQQPRAPHLLMVCQ